MTAAGIEWRDRPVSRQALRRLRLGSGLVLLTYIFLHLTNHALGIWSLELAESGLAWSVWLWQSVPGTILLYGSAAVHFALALRTIYQRRHWDLPIIEWVRLWAGFGLPLLLIDHAVATRVAASLYGWESNYQRIVSSLIVGGTEGWQLALLAPGWLHGCLGLWISLRRYQPIYRFKPALIILVALIPSLSAIGFIRMDLQVAASHVATEVRRPDAATIARREALETWRHSMKLGYLTLILAAFAAGRLHAYNERRNV